MSVHIRVEENADFCAAENIVREAFWNLYVPGCSEHLITHLMRSHPDFIPELSLVLEKDGELAGCIYYTHSKIIAEDGVEHKVVTFGPVAIQPKYHRQGLGRQMITHSIEKARQMGFPAIVISGYPYHYETYGFRGAKRYGITMPDGLYYTGLMALPLFDNALSGVSGRVRFSDVFEPDLSQLEEFDTQFAPKEKLVLPCQTEFDRACAEIDESEEKNNG